MRKYLLIGLLGFMSACDDGDLQIEQVDFDSVSISTCGDVEEATDATFFFKIDQDEALILNLESGLLTNQTPEAGSLTSVIPSASDLVYRLFSDDVSSDYFCSNIPPIEPTVIEENTATGGSLSIDTHISSATKDVKNYGHTISITGLALTNAQGESITDTSTFEYGTYTTSTANSARLETPFSNYNEIDSYSECLENPSAGVIRLYKLINDELIILDVPFDSLANEATVDTLPRKVDLSNGSFRYLVVNSFTTDEMACNPDAIAEDISTWYYDATFGTLNIETLEGETDENGNTTYTHNFSVDSLILTLKSPLEDVDDVQLNLIENAEMGSYVTFGN